MFIIRDVDYDDSYLEVDQTLVGIQFKFVDGPDEDDMLAVNLDNEQLDRVLGILEGNGWARVELPQVREDEELDICHLKSFEQYMITLEKNGLGVTMTPADKELLQSYISDYLGL